MLHIDEEQTVQIEKLYSANAHFHKIITPNAPLQDEALDILKGQGLDIVNLEDLGNRWSKRWSTQNGKGIKSYSRVLLQWYETIP